MKGIPETLLVSDNFEQISSLLPRRQKVFGIAKFASLGFAATAGVVWLIVPDLRLVLLGFILAVLCADFLLLHLLQRRFSLSDTELLSALREADNRRS